MARHGLDSCTPYPLPNITLFLFTFLYNSRHKPSYAGIAPRRSTGALWKSRFPRTRGDSPYPQMDAASQEGVPPHARG